MADFIDGDCKGGNMRDGGCTSPEPTKFEKQDPYMKTSASKAVEQPNAYDAPVEGIKGSIMKCDDECTESKLSLASVDYKTTKSERF